MSYKIRQSDKHSIKWIKAYLECLLERRMVHVFPSKQKQLELLLW